MKLKKLFAGVLSAMVVASSSIALSSFADTTNLDYNLDGKVDYQDLYAFIDCQEEINGNVFDYLTDEMRAYIALNGDADGNGIVELRDMPDVLKAIENYTGSPLLDVNRDGSVTAVDSSIILKYYAASQTGNVSDSFTETEIESIIGFGDNSGDGVDAGDASDALVIYSIQSCKGE